MYTNVVESFCKITIRQTIDNNLHANFKSISPKPLLIDFFYCNKYNCERL